ncbi:MAG TPA: dihydrolipoamide acetyltransferase family protein [Tepidisphaeraceae bacterium]|nr:dihydrolipoamide acetyltransferase family protein [Tepidisphaeraceae bacterium]
MAGKVSENPNEFLLPDLGEGLEEAELIEWCVEVGQHVNEFDIIAKVETAKALAEVPSDRTGTIAILHGKPGDKMKVHAPFVTYTSDGAPAAAARSVGSTDRSESNGHHDDADTSHNDGEREDAGTVVGSLQPMEGVGGDKVRAAPAVRRLARDLGIDLSTVTGSGVAGRIMLNDVKTAADRGGTTTRIAPTTPSRSTTSLAPPRTPPTKPAAPPINFGAGESVRVPFRGIRRTIAEKMRQSVGTAVHFHVMDDADVSKLDNLRRTLMTASGEKISFLPLVASAVARILTGEFGSDLAKLNSTVDDDKAEIVLHKPVHLGMAVDTENGLMVPVIHNADKLGVIKLASEITTLAAACRDRSIGVEKLRGGTFTISNFGSYAGRYGTTIINYPEVGILGVGRMREGVVVRDGMIGVGKLLPLTLACDHRVIDGGTATNFLAKIIELLQSPERLIPPAR